MSILKTLYILFKNQGVDEVKKGQEAVEKATKQTEQSLDKTDKALGHVQNQFTKLGKELIGFASISAAVWGTFEGIKSAIDYAGDLAIVSQRLRVNVEDLDAWGSAVKRNGGSAESFQQSLKNLSDKLYVSGEEALKVLPELADAFQKMGVVASRRYGEQVLGLDEGTILLLQKGRREVESIVQKQKELGVVTKKDAELAQAYNKAWEGTTTAFRAMFLSVSEEVLPVLIKVVKAFGAVAEYFRKHADLIIGALIAIGAAAVIAAAPFVIANAGVIALGAAIVGLIAIFALLFEDIKYFIEGNKSLIGDLLKRWPMVGRVIKAVFDDIKYAIDTVLKAYDKVKGLFTSGKRVNIGTSFEVNGQPVDLGDNANGLIGVQQAITLGANSPLAAQTSNSLVNSNVFNNPLNNNQASKNVSVTTGPITIETQASNPDDIAAQFAKGLNEHIRQTTNTFDDGVRI